MAFVAQYDICDFGDGPCFVRGSIDVVDRDGRGEATGGVGMFFKRTYSVSTKSPVAPQSTSALMLRFIAVSVVSISTSMLRELSLGVIGVTNFFGRRRSQLASRIRAIFGGGGESCGTTFAQSHTLVASSH